MPYENNLNIRNKTIKDSEKKNLSENCHSSGLIVALKYKINSSIHHIYPLEYSLIHLDEYSIIWIQTDFFSPTAKSTGSTQALASFQGPSPRWWSEKILLNFPRNSAGQGPQVKATLSHPWSELHSDPCSGLTTLPSCTLGAYLLPCYTCQIFQ